MVRVGVAGDKGQKGELGTQGATGPGLLEQLDQQVQKDRKVNLV